MLVGGDERGENVYMLIFSFIFVILSIGILLRVWLGKRKRPMVWSIPGIVTEVSKPWGKEVIWAKTDRYVGKVLHIRGGERLSKQYHKVKDESIYMLRGEMELEMEYRGGNMKLSMEVGDCVRIPAMTVHRMIGLTDCEVLEVSTPEIWDVVRLEDSYGRV